MASWVAHGWKSRQFLSYPSPQLFLSTSSASASRFSASSARCTNHDRQVRQGWVRWESHVSNSDVVTQRVYKPNHPAAPPLASTVASLVHRISAAVAAHAPVGVRQDVVCHGPHLALWLCSLLFQRGGHVVGLHPSQRPPR